jgi:hypothetical protein
MKKLTAFVELERAIHEFAVSLISRPGAEACADEKLTAFLEVEIGRRCIHRIEFR